MLAGTIDFGVLGPLQVLVDGEPRPLGAPKQRAVLAELLLARGVAVSREQLVDAAWGEQAPESAKGALQVYVHRLRKALGAERIVTHGDGYRLCLEPGELDLERFQRLVEQGRSELAAGETLAAAEDLRAALALWRGPALADLARQPVALRAAALEEARLAALELRNDAELALGRHEALLGDLAELVAEHPYRERLRAQQMLALYRAGRQTEALEAYRRARETLVEELGVEPGPALRELEGAVLRHDPALAAPLPLTAGRARLPTPPTPLVGRRLETVAVAALLRRADVRLVTLTGPGGSGKTRLALAAARDLALELPGGAVFVDLSSLANPRLLAETIAQALGVEETGESPVQGVAAHLGATPALLLLDNLEQLLPGVTAIAELLAATPRLLVLATSRAPLRLSGEHEYPVPPLPVPPAEAGFETVLGNDAVHLFLARAQAIDPSFALTDENAAAVAAICRRLDGLPLALELAAAATRRLAPAEVEQRLTTALDLLTDGARDLPQRQQTLRATLDWSYQLLSSPEGEVLRRLSVFAGGATLDAAASVLGDADAAAHAGALAEYNLLRRSGSGATGRLVLLETVREYALERLRDAGEEEAYRRRHADYFLALAERLAPLLLGSSTEPTLAELDREHDNLRAALDWAAGSGDVETEVRLAVALRLYWSLRGYLAEGRRLFERASADSADAGASLHAQALLHGSSFAFRRGDLAGARDELQTALELFRTLGDAEEAARCTAELGAVALAEGDLGRAEELCRQACAAFAAQGNRVRESLVLANLASIAAERGDYATAESEGERVVRLQRALGDDDGLGVSLHNLARVKLVLARTDEAGALLAEALELADRLGYRMLVGYALGTAGELACGNCDLEAAARLLGGSDALLSQLGISRLGEELDGYEQALDRLRRQLPEHRLRAFREAGAARPLERSVAEAKAVATATAGGSGERARPRRAAKRA